MKKTVTSLITSVLIMMLTVSCSKAPAVKKSDTDMAKETIEGFNKALKDMDEESLKKFVVKEKAKNSQGQQVGDMNTPENRKIVKSLFADIEYRYKSGTIEDGATTGALVYEIKARDLSQLLPQVIIASMQGKTQEEILKNIDKNSFPFRTQDVSIDLAKEDGQWKLSKPEEIVVKYFGFDKNPFLQNN